MNAQREGTDSGSPRVPDVGSSVFQPSEELKELENNCQTLVSELEDLLENRETDIDTLEKKMKKTQQIVKKSNSGQTIWS